MEKRELTCIGCPLGCSLTVTVDGDNITVTGNTCKRGEEYGIKEVTHPTRIVTSSIPVIGGELPLVSCKTKEDIPKDKIFDCMGEIHNAVCEAPVKIGDILIENCAGTGIPIVATRNVGVKDEAD